MGNSFQKSKAVLREVEAHAGLAPSPVRMDLGEIDDESEVESIVSETAEALSDSEAREKEIKLQQHFIHKHISQELSVDVSFQERTSKFMRKSQVHYLIVATKKSSGEVVYRTSRVFDEFVTLHKQLKDRMTGCLIPPLKAGLSGDKRLPALNLFMSEVCAHPYLREDRLVYDFFQTSEKFNTKRASFVKSEESEGLLRWKRLLRIVKTPSKATNRLLQVFTELSKQIEFLEGLEKLITHHLKLSIKSRIDSDEFSQLFQEKTKSEENDLKLISSPVSVKVKNYEIKNEKVKLNETISPKDESQSQEEEEGEESLNKKLEFDSVVEDKKEASNEESSVQTKSAIEVHLTKYFSEAHQAYLATQDILKQQGSKLEELKALILVEIEILENFRSELKVVKKSIVHFIKTDRQLKDAQKKYRMRIEAAENSGRVGNTSAAAEESSSGAVASVVDTEKALSQDKAVKKAKDMVDKCRDQRMKALRIYHEMLRGILLIELHRMRESSSTRMARIVRLLCESERFLSYSLHGIWVNATSLLGGELEQGKETQLMSLITPDLKFNSLSQGNEDAEAREVKEEFFVIHSFEKDGEKELSVVKGQKVRGKRSEERPEWFFVSEMKHEGESTMFEEVSGYVPFSHLSQTEEISEKESSEGIGETKIAQDVLNNEKDDQNDTKIDHADNTSDEKTHQSDVEDESSSTQDESIEESKQVENTDTSPPEPPMHPRLKSRLSSAAPNFANDASEQPEEVNGTTEDSKEEQTNAV